MPKSNAMTTFSRNLIRILELRAWTKQDLADKCGMERSYISKLIAGQHSPSLEIAERIAKACEVELFELLTPNLEFAA